MTIRRASAKEVIAIGALLEKHFDKDAGLYRDNHSDITLAREAGPAVSPSTVSRVRMDLGYRVRNPQTAGRLALAERLTHLEQQVLELQQLATNQHIINQRTHFMLLEALAGVYGSDKAPLVEAKAKQKFPFVGK